MNHIDIAIIILILACFAVGWKLRGVYVIIIPVAFFAAVLFANLTFGLFAKVLEAGVPNEAKRHLIGYTIAFLIAAAAVVFAGMFLAKGFDFFKLTFIDRTLGAILLITVLLVPIYLMLSFLDNQVHFNLFDFHNALKKSLLYPKIGKYAVFVLKIPLLKHFKVLEAILK
jgi:uncharacterized membrane protein required for colicin V production